MSTLKHAIDLARDGHSDDACDILRQLVATNKNDIYAWLWLAEYTPNTDEARAAAYHVLSLRPTNQRARKLLEQMGEVAVPLHHLSHHRGEDGKLKRSLVRRLSDDRRNAGLLVMFFLLILATAVFLVFGIIVSERNQTTANDDTSLETIFAPLQHHSSQNLESDDTHTQKVVEGVGGAVLEHGVKIFAYTIRVDFLFDLLRVIDSSAYFDADDQISITVAEQTIESPRYSDVIGTMYDGGEWLYEQVRNVVTSPFR
jgi:hypothetical protein